MNGLITILEQPLSRPYSALREYLTLLLREVYYNRGCIYVLRREGFIIFVEL